MILPTRTDAGRRLAGELGRFLDQAPVVLVLSPGGARVGYEVARALEAPLDVLLAGRLTVPGQPRRRLGAVAPGVVILETTAEREPLPGSYQEGLIELERLELETRARGYRHGQPPVSLAGRTAILVDDGLAESIVIRAAIAALRKAGTTRVVFAAASGTHELRRLLGTEVDDVVVLSDPVGSGDVPICDEGFVQTTESEVSRLLERTRTRAPVGRPGPARQGERRTGERRHQRSQPAGNG